MYAHLGGRYMYTAIIIKTYMYKADVCAYSFKCVFVSLYMYKSIYLCINMYFSQCTYCIHVHVQYRSDARYMYKANAFAFSCELVCLPV